MWGCTLLGPSATAWTSGPSFAGHPHHRWNACHDRGKVLVYSMLMLAGGGECCGDIEHLRSQEEPRRRWRRRPRRASGGRKADASWPSRLEAPKLLVEVTVALVSGCDIEDAPFVASRAR